MIIQHAAEADGNRTLVEEIIETKVVVNNAMIQEMGADNAMIEIKVAVSVTTQEMVAAVIETIETPEDLRNAINFQE
jgi:hypothetical protein